MTHNELNALRVWILCRRAAASIYDTKPPTPRYADAVARLLFGTAAQESGLTWERQRTPRFFGDVGGFSKWQLEPPSVERSLADLKRKPSLCANATRFVFADGNAGADGVLAYDCRGWINALRIDNNDGPGVMFARLHYLRVPASVPEGLEQQADYWKMWYNTNAGKGTAEQYLASWRRYCAPVLDFARVVVTGE
jgi:hypothetical protein